MKVLVPVTASHNSEVAVQHLVRRFMNDSAMEVHLMNVQRPLSRYVARFVPGRSVRDWHRKEADQALAPARAILDRFGVPYAVHVELGDEADCINELARRLHCDQIVLGTARKNSLTRFVESSVTNQVLEHATVPVEVIAGDEISRWERYGIPAAIGAALALWLAAAD